MSQADVARILALPVDERLHLIDLIWKSILEDPPEVALSDAHRLIV